MRVTPISEAQAADAGLRKRGLYDFEVTDAKEEVSKGGNDQIKLMVKLYDTEGRSFTLFDYLVSTEGMAYKVRHFAAAAGLLPQYERGELKASDCLGKTGRCQVGIEKAKGSFPAKNNINDYVPVAGQRAPLVQSVPADEIDDEIPF
jgi:hypothetical protein